MKEDINNNIHMVNTTKEQVVITECIYGRLASLVDDGLSLDEPILHDANMLEFDFSTVADACHVLGDGTEPLVLFPDYIESIKLPDSSMQADADMSLGLQGLALDFMYSVGLDNGLEPFVGHCTSAPKTYMTNTETVIELSQTSYNESGFGAQSSDVLQLHLLVGG